MRHVRMLGLCLVAALALGAYAVSSASALEWGKCEKLGSKTGLYSGPNCTKAEKASPKGTGEYEWRKASEVAEKRVAEGKPANVPFTGQNVGSGGVLTAEIRGCINPNGKGSIRVPRSECPEGNEYHSSGHAYVECESESSSGEAEGKNKVANVAVSFKGCAFFGYLPCNSEGLGEGEIQTSTLKGKLGWIHKATKEVGMVLEPAQKHGEFTAFICGGKTEIGVGVGNKNEGAEFVQGEKYPEGCWQVCPGATPTEEKHGGYDQVISPITPVNQMTSEFTQVYTIETELPFANIPDRFEGKHRSSLEAHQDATYESEPEFEGYTSRSMWEGAGEEITNVATPEEEGEIKA